MNFNANQATAAVTVLFAVAAAFVAGRSTLTAVDDPSRIEAIAVDYYKEGKAPQAFPLFKELAGKGDASAAYYLGEMYQFGDGAPADGKKAVKWLKLAAEDGNTQAARQLGLLYLDGVMAVQDFAQARKWLEVAARGGDRTALRNLGDMDANGFGAPADPVSAYAYYSVAALQGNDYAAVMRDRLAKSLNPEQQQAGQNEARQIEGSIATPVAPPKAPADKPPAKPEKPTSSSLIS
jgi:TPR repeat protein